MPSSACSTVQDNRPLLIFALGEAHSRILTTVAMYLSLIFVIIGNRGLFLSLDAFLR